MKRLFCGLLAMAVLSMGGAAWAGEEKDGTEFTATLKTWVNEWERLAPGAGRKNSESTVLMGPAFEAEFHNRMVLEASYMTSLSGYKFTEPGTTTEFDRRDLELAIGKWLNRYAGFFVGYRNSSFKDRSTGAKEFSYGLTYSLRGAYSVSDKVSFYGDLKWMTTRFKAEGLAREEAPGWIFEIGGRNAFTKQFSMKLGYKWEKTQGEVSRVEDTFSGMTLDVAYAF